MFHFNHQLVARPQADILFLNFIVFKQPNLSLKGLMINAMNNAEPLRICLLSYRSNPHSGGQGVYIKNLSRALNEMGHKVDVVSGPPDLILDKDINVFPLPCLDLYNPEDLFRVPSLKELADPINFSPVPMPCIVVS